MIRDMNNELANSTTMRDPLYIANSQTFAMVEPYQYVGPALRESIAPVRGDLVILAAWLLAAFGFAVFGTARLKVD